MDVLQVNIGLLIVDQITEVSQGRAKSLVYPSLIFRLYDEAGVFVRPTDEKKLCKDIYLLKKRGGPEEQKKRMIDVPNPSFGQFTKPGSEAGGSSIGAATSSSSTGSL